MESHQKTYDPFRLRVSAYSLLAGFSYEFPAGRRSGLEIGAAVGWTRARFDFMSAWTYELHYQEPELQYGFTDRSARKATAAARDLRCRRCCG